MFVDRVLDLLKQKGVSKNKMLTELNLNRNSFVNWIERNTVPSGETLTNETVINAVKNTEIELAVIISMWLSLRCLKSQGLNIQILKMTFCVCSVLNLL